MKNKKNFEDIEKLPLTFQFVKMVDESQSKNESKAYVDVGLYNGKSETYTHYKHISKIIDYKLLKDA